MNDEADEIVVRRSVTVPIDQTKAFELFTSQISQFWPKDHSIGAAEVAAVVIEPEAGGRWFERGVDGSECDWGRVAQWTPPSRLVLLWQINMDWRFDPNMTTEVEIDFVAHESGTRVDLAHRHLERYGDQAQAMYGAFNSSGGWEGTLASFAELSG